MQRQDIPHYESSDVVDVIERALLVVEEANPPQDLRAAVFTQAASMLGAKTVQFVQPQPVGVDLRSLGGAPFR